MDSDLPRVGARLFDVLERGLAPHRTWQAKPRTLESADPQDAQDRFLHAATNLINRIGYLGASVERIAKELGVSTGSFYHHIDNKDDLVVACFNRSFDLVDRARAQVDAEDSNAGERLEAMIASLVGQQLTGASPMLSHHAYQALPPDLRQIMPDRTEQVTHHYAGRIADGVADGSLRGVDPLLAGHIVVAAINGAAELRRLPEGLDLASVVTAYCDLLRRGIFLD